MNEWTGLQEDNLWMFATLLHLITGSILLIIPEDSSYIHYCITYSGVILKIKKKSTLYIP